MAKATSTITTNGGVWTTLATGESTVASLIANATVATTLVALRVTLSGGTSSYILPLNTLQFNAPNRLAIGGISLKAGDKLEALSNANVDWVTTTVTGISYKSNIVSSPANNAWTTLVSGPCLVRGLFVSTPSAGTVGIRLHKATTDASIVLSEELKAGGSKRLMIPINLLVNETIQVQGSGSAYWIATGVEVPA